MDVSQAGGNVEVNRTFPNSYPATFTFAGTTKSPKSKKTKIESVSKKKGDKKTKKGYKGSSKKKKKDYCRKRMEGSS